MSISAEARKFYVGKLAGDHQGVVVEGGTGRDIAVVYDKADTALLASAPELLALLKRINTAFYVDGTAKALKSVMAETKDLIRRAEGCS